MIMPLAFGVLATAWTIGLVVAPSRSRLRSFVNAIFPICTFAVFAVIFAVHANTEVFDKWIYTAELQTVAGHSLSDAFSATLATAREPLYVLFIWVTSGGGQTTAWLYLWVGITCTVTYLIALLRLVEWWQAPFVFLATLALGVFTAYSSLAIRQGLSMACLFAAICLILARRRAVWWIFLLVAAALFHWSAIPVALSLAVLGRVSIGLRTALIAWSIAAVLFLTGIQSWLLAPVSQYIPGMAAYTDLSVSATYAGGTNRIDFFLVSGAILLVGLFALRFATVPDWYSRAVVIYVLLNIYFLLFGFILYSDRIAVYSWSLIPLIVAVPVASPKSSVGRVISAVFVLGVVAVGTMYGPFLAMTGFESY